MISPKTLYLQEEFIKENLLMQVRMLLDKRNLKFDINAGYYSFAS